MKTTKSIAEWKNIIEDYDNRSCSRESWCSTNNITVHQIKYWRKRINRSEHDSSSNWIPLSTLDNDDVIACNSSFVVEVNDVKINVDSDFDSVALKRLLEVVKSC